MQGLTLGEYKIRIFKDVEEETDIDWFLAEITTPDGDTFMTQGRNDEEILDMAADAIMTVYEIKLSWWNKILSRLKIYGKNLHKRTN